MYSFEIMSLLVVRERERGLMGYYTYLNSGRGVAAALVARGNVKMWYAICIGV